MHQWSDASNHHNGAAATNTDPARDEQTQRSGRSTSDHDNYTARVRGLTRIHYHIAINHFTTLKSAASRQTYFRTLN
jgi:hypothetical protein